MACEKTGRNIVRDDLIEVLNGLRRKQDTFEELEVKTTSSKVWESFINKKIVYNEDIKHFTDYQVKVIAFIIDLLKSNPIDTLAALESDYGAGTLYSDFESTLMCNLQTQEYFFYSNTLKHEIAVTKKYLMLQSVS